MQNSAELELTDSTKKFISVGNNTFLNSKGSTEVCRKGLKGEYCKRHNGGSLQDTAKVRAILDDYAEKTKKKLSMFEKGCIWLYSILTKTPLADAEGKYVELTAMYSFINLRKPTDNDIKGLQKVLLRLAETSTANKSKMDEIKMMIKKMTVGKDFTEAGYYTLKDLSKDALTKMKIGAVGLGLGGTLLLSGCSSNGGFNPTSLIAPSTEDYKKPSTNPSDTLLTFEKTSDSFGEYTRTYVNTDGLKSGSSALTGNSLSAAEAAVKFLSLEALDSIALDNASRWEEWKTNVAPQYISSQYLNSVLTTVPTYGGATTSNVILNNVDGVLPTLMRDGGVRVADKRISDIKVTEQNGAYYVVIEGTAVVYADDASASAWLQKDTVIYNSDGTPMTPEQKAEAMKRPSFQQMYSGPALTDGKPNGTIVKYSVGYNMVKEGDSWKIAGFNNTFEVNQSMFENNADGQLDYRNKVK